MGFFDSKCIDLGVQRLRFWLPGMNELTRKSYMWRVARELALLKCPDGWKLKWESEPDFHFDLSWGKDERTAEWWAETTLRPMCR